MSTSKILIPFQIIVFILFGLFGINYLDSFFNNEVIAVLAVIAGICYGLYLYISKLIQNNEHIKNENIVNQLDFRLNSGKTDFFIIFFFGFLLLFFQLAYPHFYKFDCTVGTGAYLLSEDLFLLTHLVIISKYYIALNRQIIKEYKETIIELKNDEEDN